MNNYKFTDYLDSIYGDKLSIHPQLIEQINELVDFGIVFDLSNNSWIIVHEDYSLETNYSEGVAWKIEVISDNSPYRLVVNLTRLTNITNKFIMPA